MKEVTKTFCVLLVTQAGEELRPKVCEVNRDKTLLFELLSSKGCSKRTTNCVEHVCTRKCYVFCTPRCTVMDSEKKAKRKSVLRAP